MSERVCIPEAVATRGMIVILALMLFGPCSHAQDTGQESWASSDDLDAYYEQGGSERQKSREEAEMRLAKAPQTHEATGKDTLAAPSEGMIAENQDHPCACGTCRHPLTVYYSYLSIWATDHDDSPDDQGAFTTWKRFMDAYTSKVWKDTVLLDGRFYACYGYQDALPEKDSDQHRCGYMVLKHADQRWTLIMPGEASGSSSFSSTSDSTSTSKGTTSGSVGGKGSGTAKGGVTEETSHSATGSTDGKEGGEKKSAEGKESGTTNVSLNGEGTMDANGRMTHDSTSETTETEKTTEERKESHKFLWRSAGLSNPRQKACRCGEPPPPVDSGGKTTHEPPATGSTVAPPAPPPPQPPVNTPPGDQPPARQHTFRDPVRPGTADDVSAFSATLFVRPKQKFTVPGALRGKDGSLIAINEVWVQPDGEDPTPLARVGDTFAGTTPVKPAKIFAVVAGTAVGILGLVPSGGSGDGGGTPPPSAPTDAGTPPAPVSPETPGTGGRPPVPPASPEPPEPPRVSVTDPAPPADFPTKAPVVNLAPDDPSRLSVQPTEADAPDPTGAAPATPSGEAPSGEAPPGSASAAPSSKAPSNGESPGTDPLGSVSPTGQNPLVRMVEGQEAIIAATGAFTPDELPAMQATLEFPDAKIRSDAEVIFATEDTALVRSPGAGDQTGDMTVKITDPAGHTQSGGAEAWGAHLSLSSETIKEGQEVAVRIVTAGLDETRLVKYTLEFTEDALPVTPGALGQTYTGETSVGTLQSLVFRARYPSPGAKPLKLFLEPVPTEPRSPGSAMPAGK